MSVARLSPPPKIYKHFFFRQTTSHLVNFCSNLRHNNNNNKQQQCSRNVFQLSAILTRKTFSSRSFQNSVIRPRSFEITIFEQNLNLGTPKKWKKSKQTNMRRKRKKNWLRSNFKLLAFFMRGGISTTFFFNVKRERRILISQKKMFFKRKQSRPLHFF